MKKSFLMGILMCVFSAPLLLAQICQPPAKVLPPGGVAAGSTSGIASGGPTGQAFTSTCNPPPPPPPPPPPTPTPITGRISPKYVVLTVTYAPPGSSSSVTYSNSTMLGTSLSFSDSFSSQVSNTVKTQIGFHIFGIGFGGSSSSTTQYTQETDSSSSIAVNQTTALTTTIPGPASSAVGLDHDVDLIWLWLNPVLDFSIDSSNSITWTGFEFDTRDPVGDMDVIALPVKFLNGHQAIPTNIADVLARRWASRVLCTAGTTGCDATGTADPGLDANDFAAILKADPFATPSYVINIPSGSNCTADGRFCRTSNQNLLYSPPPAGGQPITQTFSISHEATATQGQGASDSREVSRTGDLNGSFGFAKKDGGGKTIFDFSFSADVQNATKMTMTNKWSSTSTQKVGQTASVTVKGPSTADNYTGPVEFEVFQDNVFGTFMFGFIPPPTFSLSASPSSQSVVQGSCTSYTASISALVSGFSSTVSFSVSGLPANTTASFSPASVTGAGNSTLTVCTSSSTPTGTSNLTINSVSGIEVHSTDISLTVNAPPPPPPPPPQGDFNLSNSPGFLDIVPPGSATSAISVSPVNGFNGAVSLSVDGGGLAASLSSTSVTGAGSVTLTVRAGRATAPGNYLVTITGTGGNLTHSTQITVTVEGSGGGCQFCSRQ